jgi:hypothetical protein
MPENNKINTDLERLGPPPFPPMRTMWDFFGIQFETKKSKLARKHYYIMSDLWSREFNRLKGLSNAR